MEAVNPCKHWWVPVYKPVQYAPPPPQMPLFPSRGEAVCAWCGEKKP